MLDNTTKRRIDTARDILVGKVPDPKSQVEQITIALIYKFMDDMDKESVEFGGLPTFFTGDYARYSWTKIFDPKLGGYEMLNLYSEAILKLNQNPNIPQLFRDIFKNAYLPYRDPETLKLFLKTINEFNYDHSEMLGDAFEYLLSVLGSQGDAGQFRTPRHIIDFMVRVVAPKKGESICDPACGTAGFLISSYKYIVEQNTKKTKGDLLTPDDRKKMMKQFTGYDISPDMVRLSLVNMYLHGFTSPRIVEYDTLTSEERWNDYYDIILANPPFMTPKGGIKPHKKFTIQASKSEVLFTDYIAEHINPVSGRAAIIVPNGIVATSQTAYKQLRKMLVKQTLIAVISLPAGVFQPYSGVKTSILILDKRLAKKANHILFLKIENDGYDLGAQRREIDKNDLPLALQMLDEYKNRLNKNLFYFDDYFDFIVKQNHTNHSITKIKVQTMATLVEKEKVLENKDVVLSAERYFETLKSQTEFELIKLEDICDVRDGTHESPKYIQQGFPLVTSKNIIDGTIDFSNVNLISKEDLEKINKRSLVENGDIIMPMIGTIGNPIIVKKEREFAIKNVALIKFNKDSKVNNIFLKYILESERINDFFQFEAKGVAQKYISLGLLRSIEIPLPPLSIQQQIVAEIEGYQKIIDGAKQILNNYKPVININPEWEMVELRQVCKIQSGGTPSKQVKEYWENGTIPWVGSTVCKDHPIYKSDNFITELGLQKSSAKIFPKHTTLIALVGATIGKTAYLEFATSTNQNIAGLQPLEKNQIDNKFLFFISQTLYGQFYKLGDGAFRMASLGFINELQIPLPSITEQQSIVKSIEEEMQLVAANKRLIEIFEQKIKDKINEVWGVKEKEYEEEDEEMMMVAEE